MNLLLRAVFLVAALLSNAAIGQQFPTRPVTLVVPYAPGGASDVLARIVAQGLGEKLGQQVVVENKAGAGVVVGSQFVASSPPDGYTLLITTLAHATNPSLFKKLPYDSIRDFQPVAMVASLPLVLCVNPNHMKATDLKGVIEHFKAAPGKYNYSSGGKGSIVHLASELFNSRAKIQVQHVPYKGGAPAMNALLAGEVEYYIDVVSTAPAFVNSGKVKAIAVTSAKRSHVFPNVPTMQEAGIADYDVSTWNMVFAPRGIPPAVLARLNQAINAAIADPTVNKRLLDLGATPVADSTPAALEQFVKDEMNKWAQTIKASGTEPE